MTELNGKESPKSSPMTCALLLHSMMIKNGGNNYLYCFIPDMLSSSSSSSDSSEELFLLAALGNLRALGGSPSLDGMCTVG